MAAGSADREAGVLLRADLRHERRPRDLQRERNARRQGREDAEHVDLALAGEEPLEACGVDQSCRGGGNLPGGVAHVGVVEPLGRKLSQVVHAGSRPGEVQQVDEQPGVGLVCRPQDPGGLGQVRGLRP